MRQGRFSVFPMRGHTNPGTLPLVPELVGDGASGKGDHLLLGAAASLVGGPSDGSTFGLHRGHRPLVRSSGLRTISQESENQRVMSRSTDRPTLGRLNRRGRRDDFAVVSGRGAVLAAVASAAVARTCAPRGLTSERLAAIWLLHPRQIQDCRANRGSHQRICGAGDSRSRPSLHLAQIILKSTKRCDS